LHTSTVSNYSTTEEATNVGTIKISTFNKDMHDIDSEWAHSGWFMPYNRWGSRKHVRSL